MGTCQVVRFHEYRMSRLAVYIPCWQGLGSWPARLEGFPGSILFPKKQLTLRMLSVGCCSSSESRSSTHYVLRQMHFSCPSIKLRPFVYLCPSGSVPPSPNSSFKEEGAHIHLWGSSTGSLQSVCHSFPGAVLCGRFCIKEGPRILTRPSVLKDAGKWMSTMELLECFHISDFIARIICSIIVLGSIQRHLYKAA